MNGQVDILEGGETERVFDGGKTCMTVISHWRYVKELRC